MELILNFLTGEKGGRVISTLVAQLKSEAMYSVHSLPRQKVEPCTQYIGRPTKK